MNTFLSLVFALVVVAVPFAILLIGIMLSLGALHGVMHTPNPCSMDFFIVSIITGLTLMYILFIKDIYKKIIFSAK